MKANFTSKFKTALKATVLAAMLGVGGTAVAQPFAPPFAGGTTYYVDGIGVDLVAPKDTFMNFSGAYANGAYTTTTGLFSAMNVNGEDSNTIGNITIMLAPSYVGYVEPNVIQAGSNTGGFLYQTSIRTVVIKPTPGFNFTITTSASVTGTTSLFRFSGSQYITIDGEGTAGQRNITFQMPLASTSTTSKVIDIVPTTSSGCQYLTIKSCNIIGSSTNAASGVVYTYSGVFLGSSSNTAAVARSQNIRIEKNFIGAANYGVNIRGFGALANNHDYGLVVRDNVIGGQIKPGDVNPTHFIGGADAAAGILLSAQANALIENNVIRNSITSFGNFRGIALTLDAGGASIDSNITINRNKIYNIVTTVASKGSYGIRQTLNAHTQPLNLIVSNNAIANISANNGAASLPAAVYPVGILVEDNSSNVGLMIVNNSIHLYGSVMPNSTFSACLVLGNAVTGGITVQNNILANKMGRSAANTTGATSYGIVVNTPTGIPFNGINNNDYYINTFDGGNAFIGYANSKSQVSINHWRTYTNSDNNSITAIPAFITDTLLELNNTTPSAISNSGMYIPYASTDINGTVRPGTNPSIGAYQFTSVAGNVNVALTGGSTYTVGGTSNWPTASAPGTGTFSTMSDAITYLNAYGTSGTGPVIFEIGSSYTNEGTRYLPAIIDYPNAAGGRPVLIRPAVGTLDTLTIPNVANFANCAVIRLMGARFLSIDGINKSLVLYVPPLANNNTTKIVAITPSDLSPVTDITISNCVLTGSSDATNINTFAGIFLGSYLGSNPPASALSGLNNNQTYSNNLIQGVRNGIYMRGYVGGGLQDREIYIGGNVIGGNTPTGTGKPTTYIGGATSQAGILVKGVANTIIDNNTIKNCVPATSNDFRGIDITDISENVRDSNVLVSNNKIFNLISTGTSCVGIRINLGTDSLRKITLSNNSIAKIQGVGSGAGFSLNNPNGIIIDATGVVTNLGVDMYYNTVQLTGNTLTGASGSSCLYLGANVRSGLNLKNNLFVNKLGRTTALAGAAYAITSVSSAGVNPFNTANNNVYSVNALNTYNYIAFFNGGQNYLSLTAWKQAALRDSNSFTHNVVFMNDSMPDLQVPLAGPVVNGGAMIPTVTRDIYGNVRFGAPGYSITPAGTAPCVGAVEFGQPYSPLMGGTTYFINGGAFNPPTKAAPTVGSFPTINKAFHYLISNGVDAVSAPANPVKLVITSGYVGEGDTLIMPLTEYPKMNANRMVMLTSDAARTITTAGGANGPYNNTSSVIRFSGGSYFMIDGSSNGTTSRDLTITLPASTNTNNTLKVIDFIPFNQASTNVVIKNCNILGSSTTTGINTYAGIYIGGNFSSGSFVNPVNPLIGGANNNLFANNLIGGVRYGVYLRGAAAAKGQQDIGNMVVGNTIGGDVPLSAATPTTYFGGADAAAGILLSAQSGAVVDSNIVKNNIRTFQTNRGIELSNASGTISNDSNITVSRNTIYNIVSTTAAAYGVYMNLGNDSLRRIRMNNNEISVISAIGTSSSPTLSLTNPSGICIDATGSTVNNIGVSMMFNSINLASTATSGSSLTVANSSSSCVSFSSIIKGGVTLKDNILQNKLTRNATGNSVAVNIGANQNIFTGIDNNNYFVNAAGTGANNLMAYNTASSPVYLNTIPAIQGFTKQDTMSISFTTAFVSDSVLDIPLFTTSVLAGAAEFDATVPTDIYGRNRSFGTATIGAVEFNGTNADSVAPRVYSYTSTTCGLGPFFIEIKAYEKNIASDTLYYRVNGVDFTAGPPSVSGRQRVYTIPAQAANTMILYRVSVNDAGGRNGRYPAAWTWDTLATSVTSYPYGYGFDGPNINKWTVEAIQGTAFGSWVLSSFGSLSNPNFATAFSGVKTALFPAANLAAGTGSRLVSPCFDLSNTILPTLRFWVSQNQAVPTKNDSIVVKVNTGFGWNGAPLATVLRYNASANYIFPGWRQVDVCLADFVGYSGLRVGIEAYSKNGNNILIDSVMMIDNFVSTPVTPLTNTICGYDSLALNIANSSPTMTYQIFNMFTGSPLSAEYNGNGGTLTVKGANPQIDSLYTRILVRNTLSGSSSCYNLMNDTAKIYTKLYKNGPFVIKGSPFSGAYNLGTSLNPDGAKVGDTLTYTIVPPSGLTNSDYGTKWTITSTSIKTITNLNAVSAVFTAPVPSTSGTYVMTVKPSDADSVFYMRVTFRLLGGASCDSTVIRAIKITSAPATSFTNGRDTACRGAVVNFTNTTPVNLLTIPYTYLWDFGDSTTSTNSSVAKVYSKAGTYTVKFTVYNNANLGTTVSKTFTVLPAPTAAFVNTRPCSGDSVAFTNNTTGGAVSFQWRYISPNPSLPAPYGNGTSTAVNPKFLLATPSGDTGSFAFRLVATDINGCTDTARKTVQLFAKPAAAFSIANHCLGSLATFVNNSSIAGSSNSFGSTWYPGNGDTILSPNPVYHFRDSGTYNVKLKVTSNYGCVDSASQVVTIYDKPRTSFTYDTTTSCQGVQLSLTNGTSYKGIVNSNKVLYSWNFGDNTAPMTDFNPTKTYGVKGSYKVMLIATDTVHFCNDTTTKTINVSETPIAQFDAPVGGCLNANVKFTNKTPASGQSVAYSWNYGDGSPADTTTSPMHAFATAGSKTVTLKATAVSGCASTATKNINISNTPVISWTSDSIDCYTRRFVASSNAYTNYVWTINDGSAPITAYRDTLPRHVFLTKGWHKVTLTVSDVNGCTGSKVDSVFTYCSTSVSEVAAAEFGLKVYPNPFTESTNISYTLDNTAKVQIRVFDMLGRTVAEFDKGAQAAGTHTTLLDGDRFLSGSAAYLVRIQIDDKVITKQIIRAK